MTPTKQNQLPEDQNLVLESMKQNRNRILFFLSLVTYCLLAVLATTDRDLFFATGIKLPLLGVELPLLAFYIVMPIFIILTHFNVLYLFDKHIKNLKEINSNYSFNKIFYIGIFDFITLNKSDLFYSIIKIFVFFVLYLLPLITLYLFWWRFNAYQNSLISFLHIFYLIVDTYIVISFIWQEFKHHAVKLFFIAFIAFIIQITIATDILPKKWHPKLSLSGEQLVNFDRNQLLVLQSLDKEKYNSLALYQPAFDLSDRSFKYADFSNSTLVNINFSNADLQGANLRVAELQGAYLYEAQLQGADLLFAKLQGADLGLAKLQGVNLGLAQLQGADLRAAQLQGANLRAAQLQGADLRGAGLQGADLDWAELQGADLRGTQLQGAYVSKIPDPLIFANPINQQTGVERINQQTDKETDIQSLEKQYKPLKAEQKEKIIAELTKMESYWIENAIKRIKNAGDALDLSKAKTGSYNKQQAQQWIEQYKGY